MNNANLEAADPRDRSKSRKVSALKELWPFLKPYKLMISAAFIALTLTAVVSLILPLAVRRVVDTFSLGNPLILDQNYAISGFISDPFFGRLKWLNAIDVPQTKAKTRFPRKWSHGPQEKSLGTDLGSSSV